MNSVHPRNPSSPKASLSLAVALARERHTRGIGMASHADEAVETGHLVSIVAEGNTDVKKIVEALDLKGLEKLNILAEGFMSGEVRAETAVRLLRHPEILFAQAKTTYEAHVRDAAVEVGLQIRPSGGGLLRACQEDGTGVLIGIVDTGFDLSHPAFRNPDGSLKIVALLDQTVGREFDAPTLERLWESGSGPGSDVSGHGTHVASIAAGSSHSEYEGIAPRAKFLLVKTNFLNTDRAVAWILRKAGEFPCVVNLSFGSHDGAHDGTGEDERLHSKLAGPGKIVVVSAGNDRLKKVHLGHDFYNGEIQEVKFDIFRPVSDYPRIALNAWHASVDEFKFRLWSPDGTPFEIPSSGEFGPFAHNQSDIYFAAYVDPVNKQRGTRIEIFFRNHPDSSALIGWRLYVECSRASLGRLDGWISLSRQGAFQAHPMVEQARTVTMPATGDACIAVASYTTRSDWTCETDPLVRHDKQAVQNRFSRFSSIGPARNGHWKPEISAPGEHICSALATDSEYSQLGDRTQPSRRLVTLAGTSMAAPIVTGVVALLLQKKPMLTHQDVREVLIRSARKDHHTGDSKWSPAYGYGKIDACKALSEV